MTRFGSAIRWKLSPQPISCAPLFTTDFGTRWIPCAIARFLRSSGKAVPRSGEFGDRPGFLEGAARFAHRPHRIQGRVDGAAVAFAGGGGHGLRAAAG